MENKYNLFNSDGKIRESFKRWINRDYQGFQQRVRQQYRGFDKQTSYNFWKANYYDIYSKDENIKGIIDENIKNSRKFESHLFRELFPNIK